MNDPLDSETLRRFFETSLDMLCIAGMDGYFKVLNPAWQRTLGYEQSELLAKPYLEFVHPDDRDRTVAEAAGLAEGKPTVWFENRYLCKDGTYKWLLWKSTPAGRTEQIFAIARDITESKESEQAIAELNATLERRVEERTEALQESNKNLAESQRTLNNFVSHLPGMAYRCRNDADWTMEYVSDGVLALTGYQADQLLHNRERSYAEVIHPEDQEVVSQAVQSALDRNGPFQVEYRIVTANGETKWVWEQGRGVYSENSELLHLEGLVIDVTERRQLQEQLLRAQRLESVGTLASGIAHDLNNALTPVLMAVQVLRRKYPDSESRTLEMLESSAKRGARLVKQVLTFGRGMAGEPVILDVRHRIKDFEKVVEQTFPNSIRMNIDVPRELWAVSADPTQLDQVLMNLGVNARDAMPDGGTLTVRAKNIRLDETYIRMQVDAKPGAYVQIEVADTGQGMPPGVTDRIFEPFFTTKESGKGTGLGLSTSHTIIKNHGGFINVYSEVGRGTTFRIYLPAAEGEAEQATEKKPAAMIEAKGQTILVADDEAMIREMVSSILEDVGYKTVSAENGADAVARVAQGGIDLTLLDWEMPVMNGRQAVQAIRKISPGARIIAASGISHIGEISNMDEPVPFLSKPYTAEDLLGRLAEVIDGSADSPNKSV